MPTSPNLGFTYPTPLDPSTADVWGGVINTVLLAFDTEEATKTIAQSFEDLALSRAKFIDNSETAYSLGNISGAVAVDYTNGHVQYGTLTGNISSLTISNWPASGTGGWLTLQLTQDGTGSRTIDLTSGEYYSSGAITLSTAASARDNLHFTTRDAGTIVDVRIENALTVIS